MLFFLQPIRLREKQHICREWHAVRGPRGRESILNFAARLETLSRAPSKSHYASLCLDLWTGCRWEGKRVHMCRDRGGGGGVTLTCQRRRWGCASRDRPSRGAAGGGGKKKPCSSTGGATDWGCCTEEPSLSRNGKFHQWNMIIYYGLIIFFFVYLSWIFRIFSWIKMAA